jgi:hypothetical protein
MSQYKNVKLNISEGQKDKIKKGVQAGTGITIRLTHGDLSGEDVLALTQAQINKMMKVYHRGTGMMLKLSKTQLEHNMKVDGGFLPALLGILGPFLLKTALPAVATGALSGLASTGISKALGSSINGGSVVYIKRGGRCYKMGVLGSGLFLKPYSGGKLQSVGEGVFMRTGSGVTSAEGLITGDSPISKAISNMPVIGPLLSMII